MSEKPILSLDFDGVIHAYTSGWQGATTIPDGPVPGAMAFLVSAVKRFRVAIFSSRSNQENGIKAMRFRVALWMKHHLTSNDEDNWCDAIEIVWRETLDALEWPTEKPPAMVSLDDRAIRFTGEWPSLDELAAFKPWNRT